MRIEIIHNLLSDSPLSDSNKSLFATIVNKSTGDLIEDIVNGNPTCYLVSGYRGSGKSSFVKKIQSEIKSLKLEKLPEIVFVHANFSQYQNHTFLLRKLIREFYLEIKKLPSFNLMKKSERSEPIMNRRAVLLEQLYDKTFYDTSYQSLNSQKKEIVTVFNIDLIEFVKSLMPLLATIFFILNWKYSWFNLNNSFNLIAWISSFCLTAFVFIKLSYSISKSKVLTEDFSRKSLYDDEIADYHLLNIMTYLQDKYKVVFVLDELDKMQDDDIDKLLNEMKPYLISGTASFIVVAGQSLFYKYSESRTIDDALLSSMFSKFIHIPLFSRIELQFLFKSLISPDQSLSVSEEQLLNNYVDYLIFESKRIPRKFISLVRQNLTWESGKSFLYINEATNIFEKFTIVNNVIDKIEDKEIATRGFDSAIKDYCVMQLYLKSHTILFTNKVEFTFDEIMNHDK